MQASVVRGRTLTERPSQVQFAPGWAHDAGVWLAQGGAFWRTVGIGSSLVLFLLSVLALFGGGYTSIQGIRLPLAWIGVLDAHATTGMPPIEWWAVPAMNVFIQMLLRHVPGFGILYLPSIMYDGGTNTVFFVASFARAYTPPAKAAIWVPLLVGVAVVVGGLVGGFLLAILAEQFFTAAIFVAWRCVRGG